MSTPVPVTVDFGGRQFPVEIIVTRFDGVYETAISDIVIEGTIRTANRQASCDFTWARTQFPVPNIAALSSTRSPNATYSADAQRQRAAEFARATIEQFAKATLRNNRSTKPECPPAIGEFYESRNILPHQVRNPCLARAGKGTPENPDHKNLVLRRAAIINRKFCEQNNPVLYATLVIERGLKDKSVNGAFKDKYGDPLNFGEWKAQYHGEYADYETFYQERYDTFIS